MITFTEEEFRNLDGLMGYILNKCPKEQLHEAICTYADSFHKAKINLINRSIVSPGEIIKVYFNDKECTEWRVVDVCSNGAAFCESEGFEAWIPKIIISD